MPSTLQVDKIIDGSATTNKELAEYSSGNWSWGDGVPDGSVLQVVHFSTESRTSSTQNMNAGFDDSPVVVNITPTSATNYILMTASMHAGNSVANYACVFRFYISGGGTNGAIDIPTGTLNGSNIAVTAGGPQATGIWQVTNYSFQTRFRCNDTIPNWSSGALTLKVQYARNGDGTVRINQSGNNDTSDSYPNTISSITAIEIKG